MPTAPRFSHDVGLTIGVEEEFHILDPGTGTLTPAAGRLMHADAHRVAEPELHRSMIETATPVCGDLDGVRAALIASRRSLKEAADRAGVQVAAAGTVPDAGRPLGAVFRDDRYEKMAEDYRQLVTEQQVCAAQVQVGVPDRELAVLLIRRIRGWLPALLAISAGSPYFLSADTGYASYRSVVTSRWPTGGPPPLFSSVHDYDSTLRRLIGSGVISDPGMIYFDVRPSARYPTLEIRISDACPLVDDVVLLAGLGRALVATAASDELAGAPVPCTDYPMLRAATWRAARSGLTGSLVDPVSAQELPAVDLVHRLLAHVRPALEHFGDWARVSSYAEELLARGTSAQRQRAVAAVGGEDWPDLAAVVAHIVRETYAELG